MCSLCRDRGHLMWGADAERLKMATSIKVTLHTSTFSQHSPLFQCNRHSIIPPSIPTTVFLIIFFLGGKRGKYFVIMEGQLAVEGEHKLSVLLQNSLSFLSCETSVIHIWGGMNTSFPGKLTSLCLMSCKNVSLNCHEITLPHEITGGLNKVLPSGIFSVYANL